MTRRGVFGLRPGTAAVLALILAACGGGGSGGGSGGSSTGSNGSNASNGAGITAPPGILEAGATAQTAPYGHAGSHATLEGFIRDHADPVAALPRYDRAQAMLPDLAVEDWAILEDPDETAAILAAVRTPPIALSAADIDDLVAFLESLSDPEALSGRLGIPETVPSGLPVPRP